MTEELRTQFLAARRAYIASQFSQLNDMQRQAVMTTKGPLLLLAGAGSGKTTVLINRIANILRFGAGSDSEEIPEEVTQEDVAFLNSAREPLTPEDRQRADALCRMDAPNPWNIIAITFTNKAANEMKDRLAALLGPQAEDLWAMTFHSACCRILRREIDRMGYTRSFTIYDASDSERVMKDIIQNMGLDDRTFPAKYVLGAISREKDKMISPEEMLERAEEDNDLKARQIAKAYGTYQQRLKENNALDFDDIIYITVEILRQFPDVRQYYQNKFHYILVDEYQDTNHMQYLLASLLAGTRKNLCVVGDDDQSIYRFRGATIDNILNFEKQYPGCQTIRLEQNYRSTMRILNAANAVIANNRGRKGKKLWTDNPQGEKITVYEAVDEGAEGNYVAGKILAGMKDNSLKDYAILYRTNAQSNALEYALKRNGVAYRIIGGTRFFDRAEVKDMLSYLCVIHNRTDTLRLKRIINNPPRGLGAKTIETAERLAEAAGAPLYSVVSDPYSYAPLEKSAMKLLQFTAMLEDLAQLLDSGMDLASFYDEVIVRTGYQDMLENKNTEESLSRLENIRELKSSILSYMENSEQPTLTGFLEEVALYTDIENYQEGDDAVVMMTMHSAKGLEFPHVFLVGFEDGLFPGMRSFDDPQEMEEERRLCYVAITRAKRTLTISYARQRMIYGRTSSSLPSRFLKELPEDAIVRKGGFLNEPRQQTRYPSASGGYAKPRRTERMGNLPGTGSTASVPDLNPGDMVLHAAFGKGMVLTAIKMGGDALLEIAFDDIGTKKLMAKSAGPYIKKLS